MHYPHLFSSLSQNLEHIAVAGGYPFLFLTVLLEGLPLIGTLVPGHVTIIIGGFLARIGILNLSWVLGISILAAIVGDSLGFYLGRRYGLSLIDRLRPYFFITDAHIARASALLENHTGKSMIIGRFSPVTRALMPFLVGASKTTAPRFWIFNILGAVGWVGSSVMLGYIFGAGYHAVAGYFGKFVVAAIVVAALVIWAYRFVNVRFHIFRHYELITLALNVVSVWGLGAVIQTLTTSSFKLGFDVWVNATMDALVHAMPWIGYVAYWVTVIGGTVMTGGLGLLVGAVFAVRRRWRSSFIMLSSVCSTALATLALKDLFIIARPPNWNPLVILDPTDYSFPSGHAAMATAFFVIVAYLAARKIPSTMKRESVIALCTCAAVAVGLSRVVLNVHWATDVVGGWCLGMFCATGSILLVRYVSMLVTRKP